MNQYSFNISELIQIPSSQNVSDFIYDSISKLILDDTLQEGFVFPNETILCEQLHVGRTSLREAYKALEVAGFISRTKKGTIVNNKTQIAESTSLINLMGNASSKEFIEFRMMLESEAAELAAKRATKQNLDELDALLNDCIEACETSDYKLILKCDRKLHKKLAQCSKNNMIITCMDALASVWYRETNRNLIEAIKNKTDILTYMNIDHQSVLDAIKLRDPELARKRIQDHIERISHKY